MKRIFLGLAVLAFLSTGFTACKDKKKDDAKTEQTNDGKMSDGKMSDGKMDATSSDGLEVPSFSDPEVTKWCQDYKNMLDEIVAAYASKDMAKVSSLSTNWAGFAGKTSELSAKLTAHPDEAQKFSAFISAVSKKYSEAMQANMPK